MDEEEDPEKKLNIRLSSFTAAEYGDMYSIQKTGVSVVHKIDPYGNTPLHLAAQHDHVAVVAMLLELGCPVNAAKSGATPLHRASFSGAVSSMGLLLQQDANLLAKDVSFNDQMTPLHKAAAGGRYLAVQLLLQTLRSRGESSDGQSLLAEALQAKDSSGRTPLDIAKEYSLVQETERDSVARWDQVAGGQADWVKCSRILTAAASAAAANTMNRSSSSSLSHNNPLTSTIPAEMHRLRQGCVNSFQGEEEVNIKSVTLPLQARFQSVIQNSLGDLSTPQSQQQSQSQHTEPPPQGEQPSNPIPLAPPPPPSATSTTTVNNIPATEDSNNNSKKEASVGMTCAACGKVTVALYPTKQGTLTCKACKRKSSAFKF